MIISDLDYLDSITDTSAMLVNGGGAIASSEFLASANGISSNTIVGLRIPFAVAILGTIIAEYPRPN